MNSTLGSVVPLAMFYFYFGRSKVSVQNKYPESEDIAILVKTLKSQYNPSRCSPFQRKKERCIVHFREYGELDFQYNEENHFLLYFCNLVYMENMRAKNWYYWKALLKLKQLLMVDIGRFMLISHFNFGHMLQSPKSFHITTKYPSALLSLLAIVL